MAIAIMWTQPIPCLRVCDFCQEYIYIYKVLFKSFLDTQYTHTHKQTYMHDHGKHKNKIRQRKQQQRQDKSKKPKYLIFLF